VKSPKRRNTSILQSRSGRAGEKGYLLLAVMLLIAVMLIAMAVEAPRIAQQIRREKELELINRGTQYALAIKRFYHKVGTYPVSLDQLDNSNHVRFLRQHYKDPMTPTGEWKLVHYGEAQLTLPTAQGAAPGSTGTLNTSPLGGAATPSPSPSPGGLGLNTSPSSSGLQAGGQVGTGGTGNTLGTLNTSNIGTGGSQIGGGQIIGVASTSKGTSIREFHGNNQYDQWYFIYDPRWEQIPGNNGIIIAAPRTPGSPAPGPPPTASPGVPGGQPGNPPAPGMPPPPNTPPATGTPAPQPTPQ
jgi:type II secretory pathway pseudopilin PulG